MVAVVFQCNAQLNERISVEYDQKSLIEIINNLEEQHDLRFFYKEEWLFEKTVSASFKDETLHEVINSIFKENGITFYTRNPNHIILLPDEGLSSSRVNNTIKKRLSIGNIDLARENAIITGTVVDGNTSSPLESVIITVENTSFRYITTPNGFFKIDLPVGNYEIKFHHPSMVDFIFPVALNSDGTLIVDMFEDVTVLQEVVVSTQALDKNLSRTITGNDVIAGFSSLGVFFPFLLVHLTRLATKASELVQAKAEDYDDVRAVG